MPRGEVLRCEITGDDDDETAVIIDNWELSLKEFGRLLSTFGGFGMRIAFVEEDDLYKTPNIEVKEPDEM